VLLVVCDVAAETTLKIVTLDCAWILRMSDVVKKVPAGIG
jgi:hypothetical protein